MLYTQFPSPPAYRNASQTVVFVSCDFSNVTPFFEWFQDFKVFYNDVSAVHSRINVSIAGISQAYLDAAKLDSEELDQLKQENNTNSWIIESTGEIITYDKAMSAYYPAVFETLDTIFSSGTSAETSINQYNLYVSQYKVIYEVAGFPSVLWSVGLMTSSAVISMSLLGCANSFESKFGSKKWQSAYKGLILLSIVLFVIGVMLGCFVLGTQISRPIPSPQETYVLLDLSY
jgi:hypothetical protein